MDSSLSIATNTIPHVLIFPLPLQGPIKGMLILAELLCHANIHVTFLNTEHNHRLLLQNSDTKCRFSRYPNFRLETISDGLSNDHPRTVDRLTDLFNGLNEVGGPELREMLTSGSLSKGSEKPVTVIIAEGALEFGIDVAEDAGIPLIYFDTISPCAVWTCFCVQKLIDAGEVPFQGKDLDAPIKSVPGMEGLLRRRDLPDFYRAADLNHRDIRIAMAEGHRFSRGYGLILNTFEELDGPIISHIQTMVPNVYPIGPLHTLLKTRLSQESPSPLSFSLESPETSKCCSLWKEDRICIPWLDSQTSKSVIYVSIGSLAMMTREQEMEFWYGLVNSGKPFLWIKRTDSIIGEHSGAQIPMELLRATKERGCIVSWAPQEVILAHPAIGGFLTHSGWNSTLEGLVEGIPMLCWPSHVDQQVISRYVSEVWKLGIDMKDTCDRIIIEKMIINLMDTDYDGFARHANRLARSARQSVREGGSSIFHLNRLIADIKLISYKGRVSN